jgi:hypothetical protein
MAVYKSSIIFLFFIGLSTLNASCGKRGEKEVKISSQVDTISFATSNKIDSKNGFKTHLKLLIVLSITNIPVGGQSLIQFT